MPSLFDYAITEQLHHSARSLVVRALGPNGTALIVKTPNQAFPSFAQLAQFKREYAIAQRCRHPGVVRPLALQLLGGRWTMLFEDTGGVALDQVLRVQAATRRAPKHTALALDDFFDIALQLCAALEEVHRHGVIHKDINPSNLVWNGARRQLQLIDFGIACELPHEHPRLHPPQALEGTLRYMAPEQTGRMNRRLDYRADFYALGATFYTLLTGQPPFDAHDDMELVHCHIARAPDWSHPALTALPGQLLAIVQRLLEKNPDQRYQSLHGLQQDLAACQAAGPVQDLSSHNGRFMVPQTLHGREDAVATMLAAFERTAAGACETVLVSGYAGIGKSAVVGEVHKPIAARRGCFLSGKCDQFQRDVPYAPLIQAFESLVRQLLGESNATLQRWAARLHAALGANLGVMVELIPQLALLVGPTEPVADAPPEQAQQRLASVFPAFVDVFASATHPLVLFLDDLQWADAATLRVLALCMAAPGQRCLLCIGAYRDNEVDVHHPLTTMRARLAAADVRVSTLALGPLTEAQVADMVAATVRVAAPACAALAALCFRKTAGNPFFLNQFLGMIHDAGHLHYQARHDSWAWDLSAIEQASYTDNVVDLLLDKIRSLPLAAQHLLQLAASIGNRFTLDTLALAVERAPWATQQDLWPALDAGLIQPVDEHYKYVDAAADVTGVAYRFLHDKVQQAAYLVVDDGVRAGHHLRIGRLLLRHTPPAQQDAALFDIVEQLNAGRALIVDAGERVHLAALNLRAGARARRAAAFHATLAYMRTGLDLLPAGAATDHAGLWLDLQLGAAEAAYLCGQFDTADAIYPLVRAHSLTPLLQVRCIAVQAHQYQLQGRLLDAIAVLREGLAQLDIAIPTDPALLKAGFDATFAGIDDLPGAHARDALLDAADLADPAVAAAMQLMHALWMASYYAGQGDLSSLMVVSMTRLSILNGNSDYSAVAYVGYASQLALYKGQIARGFGFGAMALALARRRNHLQARTQTALMFAALNSHWTQPLRSSEALYEEAFGWALEIADFVQVGVVAAVRATERIILGDDLPDLLRAIEADLVLMRANGQHAMADCCVAAAVQPIKCLLGLTPERASYDDATFTEAGFLAQYSHSRLYRAYYLQGKIRTAYLFDGVDAEALAGEVETVTRVMRGQAKVVDASFYAALTWLRALRRDPARADAGTVMETIATLQADLAGWAAQGGDHSGVKHLLVQAELARNRHDLAQATSLYSQAIDAAGLAGYVNIQAMANELCGACWLDQGQARVAAVFLNDAIARYGQWGADGKVAQLRAHYGALLARTADRGTQTQSHFSTHGSSTLDLVSLLKAAQALSNEIGLKNVLTRLIAIVRENAGGQVARLLLLRDGACRLEADSDGDAVTVLQARLLDLDAASDPQFPLSLLRYVIRTGSEVIEDSIVDAPRFALDPYVQQHRPRAVMCLPIRHGGRIAGVLYFENRLADASFTEERVAFLRMLGVQAMISIASARAHDSLEMRVAERTAQLEDANRKLATLSTTDGLTGLANRRHFDDVLRAECARTTREGQPLAVIMLDVDHFKRFNDHYGHQAGDTCLIRVAHALAEATRRASDLTARYGGEEFSIVLPNTGAGEAQHIGAALRCAIADLQIAHAGAEAGQVTISVGVAVHAAPGAVDPDMLLRQADTALYQAKAAGRNCVVLSADGA
jgi:diguanylate cyclase (GGDEF)-like protein